MPLRITICLFGSVASAILGGCAAAGHHTHAAGRDPDARPEAGAVFVENRTIIVGGGSRVVPVYRSGDRYYYTYAGSRFGYDYSDNFVARARVETPRIRHRSYAKADAESGSEKPAAFPRTKRRTDNASYRSRPISAKVAPVAERVQMRDGLNHVGVRELDATGSVDGTRVGE